jgi:hypothetical protein
MSNSNGVDIPKIPSRTVTGGILQHSANEGLRIVREAAAKHRPPSPPPVARLTILDEARMNDANPLLRTGDRVPYFGPLPTDLKCGDITIGRLERVEDASPTAWLDIETFGYALDWGGHEDDGREVSEDYADEAEADGRMILRHRPARHGLVPFTHADTVIELMAISAMRRFSLSLERCSAIVGRPVLPGKRLSPVGCMAIQRQAEARLESARIQAEAQAAQRAFEEANRVEAATLRSLGLVGIRILDEPGVTIPRELAAATMIGDTIVFRAIPGLPLPRVAFAVGEILAPQHVITGVASALASVGFPDVETYSLIVRILERHVPGRKTGPVETFSKAHLEAAREYVRPLMSYVYTTRTGLGYIPKLVCEIAVRGFLVSPPAAVALIWSELMELDAGADRPAVPSQAVGIGMSNPAESMIGEPKPGWNRIDRVDVSVRKPRELERIYSGATSKDQLALLASEAASGGIVEVGSLLSKKGQ